MLLLAVPSVAAATTRDVSMQSFLPGRGLPTLTATVLLRAHDGVLWVGTDSGVYRFDGDRFVALADPAVAGHARVDDLFQSPSGAVWIGAARGLYRWQDGTLLRIATLAVGDRGRITGDGGEGVFVRHQRHLWHVDVAGHATPVDWPRALHAGALTDGPVQWYRGHLWTSCGPALCERTADGGTRVWAGAQGVPADQWFSLRVADDGDLWVGGVHHLLHLRAGSTGFEAIASDDPVETIAFDGRGRVLTTGGGRIGRWDGRTWTHVGDAHALQSAQIRDIAFDPSGAVWLGTGGRGVLRWRGYGRVRNWGRAQGLDSVPTWAIARDAHGRLWLGNQRAGNLLVPGAAQLQPWPASLRRPAWTDAMALLPRGRSMWIVYNRGILVRYDIDSDRAQEVARDLGWAKFALVDPQGRLWLGTHGALWRCDDIDAPRPALRRVDTGLPADTNYLGGSVDDDGRLWLATSHGLLQVRGQRLQRMSLQGTPAGSGLVDVATTSDGRLWLARLHGGLLWARPGSGDRLPVHEVGDVLLRRTDLYSLEVDRAGRLWAASGKGMDVLEHGRWQRLDSSDGLAWDDQATGAFLDDADGSIWLGTSGGVSHLLRPGDWGRASIPAPVVLQARYGDHLLRPGRPARVPWTGRALTVSLARTGDVHAVAAAMQYRLLGGPAEGRWDAADGNSVHLAALAPGHYRLQVRVVDPYLRTQSTVTTLALNVVPPWWRSGVAWGAYVLGIALVLLVLWRWRSGQLLRRQAQLERLVTERTRELEDDKRALEAARQALQHEASHDALTGLLNRGAMVEALVDATVDQAADRHPFAVILIDLDHFKRVNDTHGHLAGDAVLVQCAQRLRRLAAPSALLGRYGGEELIALWPGLATDADLDALFAPLVSGEYTDGRARFTVTCSVGVAWARHGDDVSDLLRRADEALYRAKRAGRARVERAD